MIKYLIKYILFILPFMLMFGCKNYRINNSNIIYDKSEVQNFVEEKHLSSNKVEDVPRHILKLLSKQGIFITSDFILFNSKYANGFLLNGGTNKKKNKGYLIIKTHEINKNTCILYVIERKRITFSLYEINELCTNWDCAKSLLIPDNTIILYKMPK